MAFMLGSRKRRRRTRYQKALESIAAIEGACLERVSFIIEQERGTEQSATLSQSVVDLLLARPLNGDANGHAAIEQIAAHIVGCDKELRDTLFISLRTILALEGDDLNFAGERRVLETIMWLKRFGEILPNDNDADLIHLAAKLRASAQRAGNGVGDGFASGLE